MLRARVHRGMLAQAIAAVCVSLAVVAVGAPVASAAQGDTAWLFDSNTVVELDLGLSPAAVEALEAEPDEYQCATFQVKVAGEVKGQPLGSVGIRLKGSASFEELGKKPAFKVKFDECVEDQTFFGLEKLTLNNMVQDPSMLHETLSYDLFRAMGVPAPRTGYAFTRLNGEPIGVHVTVETYDQISLPPRFDSTRHLYEADSYDVDVVTGGAGAFEVDEGDDEDIGDLEALILAANAGVGDWSDGMAAVADLEEMTRMWAVERYIGHWDGYAGGAEPVEVRPNNYYLHSEDSGMFQMLPWGTDQTWDDHLGFDGVSEPAGGLLFNECYADTSCRALYDEALEDLQSLVGGLEFPRKVSRFAELLAPCQALELESRRRYSAAEIADEVAETLEFVESRYIPLQEYLENSAPPVSPETANPPTEKPCSPDPSQVPGAGSTAPPSQPQRILKPRRLRIGPSRAAGAFVATRLSVPSAGRATQRVTASFNGSRRSVCQGQARSAAPGSLAVRCRLSEAAQDHLESAPMRLKVKVGFTPSGGKPTFERRRLAFPKRP